MSHTYSAMYSHAVFSTKDRLPTVSEAIDQRLYAYLGTVVRSEGAVLMEAGGMLDHSHLLLSVPPRIAPSELMSVIKSNSSRWIKETFPAARDFAWQTGYGIFSVSKSNLDQVRNYIRNQREHHRTMSFQEEFLEYLHRHDIDYDPRYIWD
jgi:putative transposase